MLVQHRHSIGYWLTNVVQPTCCVSLRDRREVAGWPTGAPVGPGGRGGGRAESDAGVRGEGGLDVTRSPGGD